MSEIGSSSKLDAALAQVNSERRRFLKMLLSGVAAAPLLTSAALSFAGQPNKKPRTTVKAKGAPKAVKASLRPPQIKSSPSQSASPNSALKFSPSQNKGSSPAVKFSPSQGASSNSSLKFSPSQNKGSSPAVKFSPSQGASSNSAIKFSPSQGAAASKVTTGSNASSKYKAAHSKGPRKSSPQ